MSDKQGIHKLLLIIKINMVTKCIGHVDITAKLKTC